MTNSFTLRAHERGYRKILPGSSFVLRAEERGYQSILSTGAEAAYVAGHPDAFIERHSSFNFHEYQEGRPGFGRMRVFSDEVFHHAGCGYNMHPHHNFIICAVVLAGTLTHINTIGKLDQLGAGDCYVFSAGSGGKHSELNIEADADMHAIYIWLLPDRLYLPPSYARRHFDLEAGKNRIVTLFGEGGLPLAQDARVSRLVADTPAEHVYRPRSPGHGVYVFVVDGRLACEGTELARRDSIGLWGVDCIACRTGPDKTDILFVETVL
jgi:redox-sensitive bicupin YhaK (pirin superfamily)